MQNLKAPIALAWLWLVRLPIRSLATATVAFSAMFVVSAALMLFTAINPSGEQLRAAFTLGADVTYQYASGGPDADKDAQASLDAITEAVKSRWGEDTVVVPSVVINDVTASHANSTDSTGQTFTLVAYREYVLQRVDVGSANSLVEGRWPAAAGELSLSVDAADALGAGVGGAVHLALSNRELAVVGIHRNILDHAGVSVIAEAGTWQSVVDTGGAFDGLTVLRNADVFVSPDHRADFEQDTSGFGAGIPIDAIPGFEVAAALGVQAVGYANQTPEFRPFWVRNILAFTAPVVALLAVIIIAQQAIRLRRDSFVTQVFTAIGLRRREIVTVTATMGVIPVLIGLTVGTLSGALVGFWFSSPVAAAAGADASTSPPPISPILMAGAFLALVSVAAGVLAGLVATSPRSTVTNGFDEESPPLPRPVRPALVLAAACVVVSLIALLVIPDDGWRALVSSASSASAALLLLPVILNAISRISPRMLALWLAAHLGRFQQARVIAMSFVVAVGVAAPLALTFVDNSYLDTARASQRPRVPAGQVALQMYPDQPLLSPAQLDVLEAAAGEVAIPFVGGVESDSDSYGWLQLADGNTPRFTIVTDRVQATSFLAWPISDDDWSALHSGAGLWVSTDAMLSDRVGVGVRTSTSASVQATGRTVSLATASTPFTNTALAWGPVVITEATAERVGIPTQVQGYRFPTAASRYSEVVAAAATLGLTSDQVRQYEEPVSLRTPVSFSAALLLVSLLVAAAIASLSWVGARETSHFDTTLTRIGLPRRRLGLIHLTLTAAIISSGCLIGVLGAIGIASADLFKTGGYVPLAVSGKDVAMTIGIVATLSAVASLVATLAATRSYKRRRHP